jgi:hypothetical protein
MINSKFSGLYLFSRTKITDLRASSAAFFNRVCGSFRIFVTLLTMVLPHYFELARAFNFFPTPLYKDHGI